MKIKQENRKHVMSVKFHYTIIRTFCNATEDGTKVGEALKSLIGDETKIEKNTVLGHHGNPITVFETRLTRDKDAKIFLQKIVRGLGSNGAQKLAEFIDDHCTLLMRFDKQKAYQKQIALGGDGAIVAKIKIAVFPVNRDAAVMELRSFINATEETTQKQSQK